MNDVEILVLKAKESLLSEIYNDFRRMLELTPLRADQDTYYGEKFVYKLIGIRHRKRQTNIRFAVIPKQIIYHKKPTKLGYVVVEVKTK